MDINTARAIFLNEPEFFRDNAFLEWLGNTPGVLTNYRGGEVYESTSVTVLVSPGLEGEGSDSDMPEHIWTQIMAACKQSYMPDDGMHIIVVITNIED